MGINTLYIYSLQLWLFLQLILFFFQLIQIYEKIINIVKSENESTDYEHLAGQN